MKRAFFYLSFIIYFYSSINNAQPFDEMLWFNIQDTTQTSYCNAQPLINNNEFLIFYTANSSPADTIYFVKSTDLGMSWSTPTFVSTLEREQDDIVFISAIKTNTGRLLVIFTISETPTYNQTKFVYSDNSGSTWSLPQNIIGTAFIPYPKITETTDGKLWIVGLDHSFFYSIDDGATWSGKHIGFYTSYSTAFDLISIDTTNFLTTYDKYDSNSDSYKIYSRKSTDGGNTWGTETLLTEPDSSEKRPRLFKESNGTIWLITQKEEPTPFQISANPLYQQNITYRKSTDNGTTWSSRTDFTNYLGLDGYFNICEYNDKPLITFLSDRKFGKRQIWIGQLGTTIDDDDYPVLYHSESSNVATGISINIKAFVGSAIGVQNTSLSYELNNIFYVTYQMFDDGNHNDYAANDNIWGLNIGPFNNYDVVNTFFQVVDNNSTSVTFDGLTLHLPPIEIENRWMSVGSLHNWYSSIGSELEHGFVPRMQYGTQWPAIYRYQDMQGSKGLWLGCADFTDENNDWYPYKVVTAGPRDPLFFALYPQSFKTISKFEPTYVTVNGYPSYDKEIIIDSLDSDLIWDRVIVNKVNTQLGVTIERKISQLSQGFNDNYIINEYILTNTGNTDYDEEIELPNNTIDSLYLFLIYRYAINQSTRYVIGNSTGWGINTMNDARGDGVKVDLPAEQFRAMYSWHGYFPGRIVPYDNIGGPIWELNSNALTYNVSDDTIGRLGAAQFVGTVTLHADKSTTEKVDDLGQPSTTSFIDSDMPLLQAGSDAYNIDRMTQQYNLMRTGHQTPRHADLVVPSGDYANQTSQANVYPPGSGGTSYKIAYGPYTLLPGDSIRIVVAECAAGMSREEQIRVGELFKAGTITAYAKNTEVINQGRDSLFSTFQNAIEAFNEGWNIPQPPRPPATFSVVSDSPKIVLDWTLRSGDPNPPVKIRIYRSQNFNFGDCEMIAELEDTVTHYEDTSVQIGKLYYYYMTCVGQYQSGGAATPPGELESGRYYTQTYDPVKIGLLTDVKSEFINPYEYNLSQNYPNPFNPITTIKYQIPEQGFVTIKVYDVLGSEVSTLVNEEKPTGTYELNWYAANLPSGVYFYRLQAGSFVQTRKMILLK